MIATVWPSKVVQGSFKQENALFACMALFTISYSTIKVINRCEQSDLDIVLVNGDALYKTFLTFLSAKKFWFGWRKGISTFQRK